MKITYREPHGERELEAIFNLRYQVYVEELGRPITHTNHQTKQIKDNVDAFATHYVAVVDGQIIGAMRTHKLADGKFPGVELYQPHLFEAYYPDQICFCSYLVIAKEHRNSMAAIKLTCKSYEYMRQENMQVNLMNCSPNLLRIYQYLGHRFYLGENFFYDSFQFSVTPMALIMEDIDFLKSLRSPLYKIAAKFTNSPSCARFFNAKFGHQNQELPPFCQSKFALRRKHFKACHFTPELRTLIKEHSRQELTFLSEQIDRIQMYKGDILYRKGDVSNAIYLLIEHQPQTQKWLYN